MLGLGKESLTSAVTAALAGQPVFDMHTHLYSPRFGTPVPHAGGPIDPSGLLLWGVDDLLTYHYLTAEFFRVAPLADALHDAEFRKADKVERADRIWKRLFVERSPVSEACRGVVTTLERLGLDTSARDLRAIRKFFAEQDPDEHVDRVMELANVRSIVMTNDVFDDNERRRWLTDSSVGNDERFAAAVRIDPLLSAYPSAAEKLRRWGYDVRATIDERTVEEARRFLREWIERTGAIYVATSLSPEFAYPVGDAALASGEAMLEKVVLPVCAERRLPFAMMIGVKRGVNPALGDAGDGLGKADVESVATLCRRFPENKFLVTMLSRENQHELCVAARKFRNLLVFGCWWFLNTPSLIEEITRMRVELLGTDFIPQHSDARVLEQLIYKWEHSRSVIATVLGDKYEALSASGWRVTEADIRRDVRRLLNDNFAEFLEA